MEPVFNLSETELRQSEVARDARELHNYRHFKNMRQEVRIAGDALLHCNHYNDEEVCRLCTIKNCSLKNND